MNVGTKAPHQKDQGTTSSKPSTTHAQPSADTEEFQKIIYQTKRNRYLLLQTKLFWRVLSKGKLSFKKIFNVISCSLAYLLKLQRSGASPFILSLELWNECNAGCLFCRDKKGIIHNLDSNDILGSIEKGKMPVNMAMDLIEQVKDNSLIAVLYTNGEPLLYPELAEVIRFSTKHKMATMIATNGLLFDHDNIRQILGAGIDLIKIQLSGFSQEVYSVQIRYGEVEKLKQNIRDIVKINKTGGYRSVILLDYILYNYNKHELSLVKNFCKDLGIMLSVRSGNPAGGLEDLEPALKDKETLPLPISCDWLWKSLQINWNGDILQCCEGVVWSSIRPYARFETGKTDLNAVFNSPEAISLRKTMTTQGRGAIPICSQCQRRGICFKW